MLSCEGEGMLEIHCYFGRGEGGDKCAPLPPLATVHMNNIAIS